MQVCDGVPATYGHYLQLLSWNSIVRKELTAWFEDHAQKPARTVRWTSLSS